MNYILFISENIEDQFGKLTLRQLAEIDSSINN